LVSDVRTKGKVRASGDRKTKAWIQELVIGLGGKDLAVVKQLYEIDQTFGDVEQEAAAAVILDSARPRPWRE